MLAWIARLLGAAPPPKAAAKTPPRRPRPHALRVRLSADRRLEGTAEILDAEGAVLASGWAIGAVWHDLAKAAGNPDADPLLPFGDVPAGRYALARAATDAEPAEVPPGEDVGAIRPMLFVATDGPALRAHAAGRLRLAVHAGRRGPACGALRVAKAVMAFVADLPAGAVLAVEDAPVQSKTPPRSTAAALSPPRQRAAPRAARRRGPTPVPTTRWTGSSSPTSPGSPCR